MVAIALAILAILQLPLATLHAQGTAFTYQGRLNAGNTPANGTYNLTFTLYATNAGGASLAGPVTNLATAVSNGLFTTTIDFGNVFTGLASWLEIGVQTNGATNFTILAPRQPVTPVPYAITASNVTGPLAITQLPAAVVTNGAIGLNLTGSFSGNGAGLTNLNAASVTGTFTSLSVGSNFSVSASGNVTANNLSIIPGVSAVSVSVNLAPNATNFTWYPLDITASNFVVLGTAIIANTNPAYANFYASPQSGITNGAGVDTPSWALAFGIDGNTFTFQTLDAGQSTIVSVDGYDASPAITLPSDANESYVQVTLSAHGYHWITLKNVNNYAPITNGFFSTPSFAYTTMAIMGDSFIDITPTNTFPDYLAEFVPGLNVCKFGEGGTGWEATQAPSYGYTNFYGRIYDMQKVNPSYIIFAGGINDWEQASANSNAYYQIVYNTAVLAKATYPNAKFAILSPFWPQSPVYSPVLMTSMIISNACVSAALITSNQFFHILSPPLVTGNQAIPNSGTADQYTSSDTTHPTPKGAAAIAHWLATKMAGIWPQLFYAAPAGSSPNP
jgi:lysophospholipase L1-like esterase